MDIKEAESEQIQWPENGGDLSLHKVRPFPQCMVYIQVHTPLGFYYEENLANLYKLI